MPLRLIVALVLLLEAGTALRAGTVHEAMESGGQQRTYELHVPDKPQPNRAKPLVIVFHGSGSNGVAMEKFSKFSALADREGFIVAYPDAVRHEWNDGREARSIPSQARHVDDVAFVDAMITRIASAHRIDSHRVFAAGFSNGGIFAHYLGSRLAGRLAAIAPVGGGLAEPASGRFKPAAPLSVCIIHGAADKLVPYGGGEVDVSHNGRIIATEQSASLWTRQAGVLAAPTTSLLSGTTSDDHRRVKFTRWPAAKSGTEVVLYTIEDGGHAWPAEPEIRRERRLWRMPRSFDATTAIWDFFKKHPKA
jgi:polyhydroxybutyrate depolymerase